MTSYVVGFAFSPNADTVLLIRKNRPEWQRGLLNGVGGHVEPAEIPYMAMRREFEEEAGVKVLDWVNFCTLHFPECVISFFHTRLSPIECAQVKTMTDEELVWTPLPLAPTHTIIPNLHWLIPLALDDTVWFSQARGRTAPEVDKTDPKP